MKILFAAGGSIGHIAPCIAVWRAVEKKSRGCEAHFVCSTRPEDASFLTEEKVNFTALAPRSVSVFSLPVTLMRAWTLLGRCKPDVVFTKGGGVTIPVAFAARLRGIPVVVHESDAVPGRATRCISPFADKVCFGFPRTAEGKESADRSIYTGNPLRPGIAAGSRKRGLALTGFSGDRPILLVTGGSQGATALNDAVKAHLPELLADSDIVHITGKGKKPAAKKQKGYWSAPFVHRELADLYAIADLAVSRSGAGSISELAANGVPALLVPLEGVAHEHQMRNAEYASASGGCLVMPQGSLWRAFVCSVAVCLQNPGVLRSMGEKMRTLSKADADDVLAKILLAYSS